MIFFILLTLLSTINAHQLTFTTSSSNSHPLFNQTSDSDTSNLIFISFASLFQQWSNTFYPNGHSIIPGLIPRGTRLYHGLNHQDSIPQALEWLAFDPEMSHSIHSRGKGSTQLLTYQASRSLQVICFDGQSASLGQAGFMDSQTALIEGKVNDGLPDGNPFRADYLRAEALCKLGSSLGFEGVVRMNTGLELIWCDFQIGIELLTRTNTTAPINQDDPQAIALSRQTANWEWTRSATAYYHLRDQRLILKQDAFISFYDRIQSLNRLRADRGLQLDRAHHRLNGISSEDVQLISQRLHSSLRYLHETHWKAQEDAIDWSVVVRDLIHHHHARLLNLVNLDLRTQAQKAHRIAYAILMPYLDTSHPHHHTLQKCQDGFIPHLFIPLTESELILSSSIQQVLNRICTTILKVYDQTLPIDGEGVQTFDLQDTQSELRDLLAWLDWPTNTDCHPSCLDHEEICLIPMWPVSHWFKNPTSDGSRCVKFEDLDGHSIPPHPYPPSSSSHH